MKQLTLLISLFFLCQSISATHIIGGTLTYVHLGGEAYEIKLEVIRDCWNGNPNAYFDDPAAIGVFDVDGNLVDSLLLPFSGTDDTLSLNLLNNVCSFPINICVHRTYYTGTVTLPSQTDGYTLAYQRCCRSATTVNLIDPLATGMTFHTHIDTSVPNSSPQYNNDIPFAVFANTPFVYNASATDADGDSLVYELVNPFTGADQVYPQPNPPSPPPYAPALFVNPPYSVANMLDGGAVVNYPLVINSETGEMSAIPSTLGNFQIAYSIKEIRNGELIGSTFREFLFVVIPAPANQEYNLSGSVLIEGNTPLDLGQVQILERDIVTDSLSIYDEQSVGTDGTYSFTGIPPGIFYVKAVVDPASVYYDTYLPTYYDAASFWYDADPLNQCDTTQSYRDIHLLHVDSLVGMVILDGYVSLPGSGNASVSNLDLLLQNENDEFIQSRTTSSSGYFKFENLEAGNYRIFADLVNSNIYNTSPPEVVLIGDSTVQVYLFDEMLTIGELTSTVSIGKENGVELNLYPNPTKDRITANIHLQDPGLYTLKISNLYGQHLSTIFENKFLPKGDFNSEIDLNMLSAGTYFIELQYKNAKVIQKMLKY